MGFGGGQVSHQGGFRPPKPHGISLRNDFWLRRCLNCPTLVGVVGLGAWRTIGHPFPWSSLWGEAVCGNGDFVGGRRGLNNPSWGLMGHLSPWSIPEE